MGLEPAPGSGAPGSGIWDGRQRQGNIETEREGDRETERQNDRETERQRDRETERVHGSGLRVEG